MPSLVTFHPVVSEKKSFEEIVDDARTDARRRTEDNPNSSPWHFVPGELKTNIKSCQSDSRNIMVEYMQI